MTDREILAVLARVQAYLYHLCPAMDLLADVRQARAALDDRLAEPDAAAPLAPPEVHTLFLDESGTEHAY